MRILGIDPGSHIVGYGALDCDPSGFSVVTYGTIQAPPKTEVLNCLKIIYQDMNDLLTALQPEVVVVEQLFFFRNAKTVMSVAQARGILLLAIAQHNLHLAEYTPLQVKMALTGHGRADKKQVQEMVAHLLKLQSIPKPDDAADALAIAICHAHHQGF